ncbi:MAG TPA: TAXI family TRAP transporter solute-binding subunit [Candidatus Polarisedimenticolaceae bacterium]|nr:TAXI family TRAP transporter solute-binding subunit [Candidatus Polarisedimenticolaceae bacterium]
MRTLRVSLIIILSVLFLHQEALAITIATGSQEGTYYKIAQDIKQIAEKEGIPIEIIPTNGSFDNINLLGAGKVDLAIVQLDVLKFVAELMQKEADFNVFEQAKVVLNLYLEEIHVITRNEGLLSLYQLENKKVAVGPQRSGSALSAEVLLAGYDLRVQAVFDAPNDALGKLKSGELDAMIFVGGAPVPAFENLDDSFHLVRMPANNVLEQIYRKQKLGRSVYSWADDSETYAVPSVIMTRERNDREYVATLQKLLIAILLNKETLDSTGHPKWKNSFIRSIVGNAGYRPAVDVLQIFDVLEGSGYRIIKK